MATITQITYYCDWPECNTEIPEGERSSKEWNVAPGGLQPKLVELCKAHRTPLVVLYGKREAKPHRGPRAARKK